MPGCILQVAGTDFDPDSFLANSTLQSYKVWRRGEPVALRGSRASRMHEWSGFRCDVSGVDGDLRGQVADAIGFISTHRADFERLAVLETVEDRQLDFGYDCRLGNGIAVQGDYLPVEFLRLVGQFNVAVALSLYPVATQA